jgi:GHMP kinases N terminal domain
MSITVRAAAKINLHLGVGRAREDGFHPLDTVYQAIGIHDDLTLTAADGLSLVTHVADHIDPAAVPPGPDNIVLRAARLLAEHAGREAVGSFEVRKDIPVAGGMAGGSADAAAALVACDRLWDLRTSDDDLLALAAQLGSDIPFSLVGGTARGVGREQWFGRRGRCTTTSRTRRSTCVPSSVTSSPEARPRARCAAWSAGPGRPSSSSATPPTVPARPRPDWPAPATPSC